MLTRADAMYAAIAASSTRHPGSPSMPTCVQPLTAHACPSLRGHWQVRAPAVVMSSSDVPCAPLAPLEVPVAGRWNRGTAVASSTHATPAHTPGQRYHSMSFRKVRHGACSGDIVPPTAVGAEYDRLTVVREPAFAPHYEHVPRAHHDGRRRVLLGGTACMQRAPRSASATTISGARYEATFAAAATHQARRWRCCRR